MELHRNGVKLARATMMDTPSAAAIVDSWDIRGLFSSVRGADLPCSKGDLIRLCMEDVGAKPEETLMVGDIQQQVQHDRGQKERGGFRCGARQRGLRSLGFKSLPPFRWIRSDKIRIGSQPPSYVKII